MVNSPGIIILYEKARSKTSLKTSPILIWLNGTDRTWSLNRSISFSSFLILILSDIASSSTIAWTISLLSFSVIPISIFRNWFFLWGFNCPIMPKSKKAIVLFSSTIIFPGWGSPWKKPSLNIWYKIDVAKFLAITVLSNPACSNASKFFNDIPLISSIVKTRLVVWIQLIFGTIILSSSLKFTLKVSAFSPSERKFNSFVKVVSNSSAILLKL